MVRGGARGAHDGSCLLHGGADMCSRFLVSVEPAWSLGKAINSNRH